MTTLFTHEFHVPPANMVDVTHVNAQDWLRRVVDDAFAGSDEPGARYEECTAFPVAAPGSFHGAPPAHWQVTVRSDERVLRFVLTVFGLDYADSNERRRLEATLRAQPDYHRRAVLTYMEDKDTLESMGWAPYGVLDRGHDDIGDFSWVLYMDTDSNVVLYWTDGVANDWAEELPNATLGRRRLAYLIDVVHRQQGDPADDAEYQPLEAWLAEQPKVPKCPQCERATEWLVTSSVEIKAAIQPGRKRVLIDLVDDLTFMPELSPADYGNNIRCLACGYTLHQDTDPDDSIAEQLIWLARDGDETAAWTVHVMDDYRQMEQ